MTYAWDKPIGTALAVIPAHVDRPDGLEALLDRIARAGDGDRVSIADIRGTAGERSFGPLLGVIGLVAVSPLGIIPGVPTVLAATAGVVAAQLVVGRREAWLPGFLLDRSFDRARIVSAIERLRPVSQRIDRVLRPRLTGLTQGVSARVIGAACLCICVAIPALELIPFMATGPTAVLAAFGLSMFLKDGLIALAAMAGTIGTAALAASILF